MFNLNYIHRCVYCKIVYNDMAHGDCYTFCDRHKVKLTDGSIIEGFWHLFTPGDKKLQVIIENQKELVEICCLLKINSELTCEIHNATAKSTAIHSRSEER